MAQTTAILRAFSTPSSPRPSIPLSIPTFRSHSRNPPRIPIAHSSPDGRSSSLCCGGGCRRIALWKPIIRVAGRVRNSVSSAPELESASGVFDHSSPLFAVDDSDDVAEFCEMALIRTRLRLVVGLLSRISRDPEVAKVVSLGHHAQEFLSGYEFADNDAVEIKRIQEALSAAGDDDGEILAVQQFLAARCNSDPGLVQLFEIFDANFTAGDINVLALAHMAKMTAEALMFPAMEYFADEMGKFWSLISHVEGQEQKGKRQSFQKKTLGEDLAEFAKRLLNRDDEMRRWMPIRNAQIIRNLSSTTASSSVPGNSERWGSDYYIYNSIFGESSSNESPGLGSNTLTGSDSAVKGEGKSSSLELDVSHKYKDLWVQCENCYGLNYKKFLKTKMNICEHCGFHLKMSSTDRIDLLIDPGTWDPMDEGMVSVDPIEFHSEDEPYKDRIDSYQRKTGLTEAVQTGVGQMNGIPVALGVMDFQFMGGSMGSVVGEKITRLIEHASSKSLPLVIVCASGGARMQEGSMSLMQMAKISAALHDYQTNKKLFYVPVLSSPTTGGVTASFGMLGDIIIAEPNAYIAFAGKRVIEQTLNKTVPEGSQVAEFLFEKGLFDLIVPRNILKSVLIELLMFHAFLPLNQNTVET